MSRHLLEASRRATPSRSAATAVTVPDCLQVCLALIVTREGRSATRFPRQPVDVTTLQEIDATMGHRYGAAQRVWKGGARHMAASECGAEFH